MSQLRIRKVAVLGAGVMGAQIAAHLVNANVDTVLFDLAAKEGDKNGIVTKAIANLGKLSPAPLAAKDKAAAITPANYDEHLELLRGCDLIIEAIAERLDWKKDLYAKILPFVAPNAVLASNTSGLSINALSDVLDESLHHRFCGVHFFNPPRYMHLAELIPCAATDAAVLQGLESFLVTTLGKGVVYAKDTPNFIGNRIGVFSILSTLHHTAAFGLGFDEVDALTGPLIGRPKSATYRTSRRGRPGHDGACHQDHGRHPARGSLAPVLQGAGLAAGPDRQGRARPEDRRRHLPEARQGHRGARPEGAGLPSGHRRGGGRGRGDPEDQESGREVRRACAAQLIRRRSSSGPVSATCSTTAPSTSNRSPTPRAMSTWRSAGATAGTSGRSRPGKPRVGSRWRTGSTRTSPPARPCLSAPLPAWAVDGRTGVHEAAGSFSPARKALVPRSSNPVYQRQRFPDPVLGEVFAPGQTVFETDSVRMWHDGDGIAVLSFKSKMNTVGDGVLAGIQQAIDVAEKDFQGLVIWQTKEPFSAGADLSGAMASLAAGKIAEFESHGRHLPGHQPAHQVRAGAGRGGGPRPCAGRRLRVPDAFRAHRVFARELHRSGRSRRRLAARRWRPQGDRHARWPGRGSGTAMSSPA